MNDSNETATVDDYIASLPGAAQTALQAVREALHEVIPAAEEAISYRVPALKLAGRYVIYFAAHTAHVGIYPAPTGDADFQAAIAPYRSGRGTLRFALDKPLPVDTVKEVGRAALQNHADRQAARAARTSRKR